jgi:hypothetical protein
VHFCDKRYCVPKRSSVESQNQIDCVKFNSKIDNLKVKLLFISIMSVSTASCTCPSVKNPKASLEFVIAKRHSTLCPALLTFQLLRNLLLEVPKGGYVLFVAILIPPIKLIYHTH